MEDGNVNGSFIVYVDDAMIFAPPEWVMGTIRFVQSLWACNIGGTMMPRHQIRNGDAEHQQGVEMNTVGECDLPIDFKSMLRTHLHFLGVTLEITTDGVLTMHQRN